MVLPSMSNGWCWPGTASFLPFRAGIQNEWMTSLEVIVSATWRCTGMIISLAVMMSPLAVWVYAPLLSMS